MQGGPTTTPALTQVFVSDTTSVTDGDVGCQPDGMHGPCSPGLVGMPIFDGTSGTAGATGTAPPKPEMTGSGGSSGVVCGVPDPSVPQVVGQPIAVAFEASGKVVVQSREPAMLAFADGTRVTLSTVTRADTGHLVFHSNAGGNLACASCHAEGNDDGRIWNFTCQGPRRTQSLHAGALRGSEPFHWDGEETDMTRLMNDVFVGRMSGPTLATDQIDTLLSWIDKQPRVPRARARRSRSRSNGAARCSTTRRAPPAPRCHSGAGFTNNATVDVGTGRAFQVPSLVGIGSRGPFMHDGCAKTLAGRFDPACGGGDRHGKTSGMTPDEINDLVSYLQSI